MTISLTYLDDLSRVRVAGSGLADGYVRVEHSINGLLWETVRGGLALEVVSGAIQIDHYEFVVGAANHYRVVPAVDETFDVPATDQLFGDPWEVPAGIRELTFGLTGAGSGGNTDATTNASSGGGGGAYAESALTVTPGETLLIRPGRGGVATTSGVASAVIRGTTTLVRAAAGGMPSAGTGGAGGSASSPDSIGGITFAGGAGGSRQSTSTAGGGGGGAASAAGAGGAGGAGAAGVGGAGGMAAAGGGDGGIGGNTSQDGADGQHPGGGGSGRGGSTSQVSGVGAHGQVTAQSWPTGTPESDTITPQDDRIWLKSIRYPLLNRPLFRVIDHGDDIRRPDRGRVNEIAGRSLPVSVNDLPGSQRFTLFVQVPDDNAAAVMDLVLAVRDTILIQVPPGKPTPGGYVHIYTTAQQRPNTQARFVFELPCAVEAPPGPDVTPTTLTWGTVRNLYGSWTALRAAHPTWASLLATVGSPDDLVAM